MFKFYEFLGTAVKVIKIELFYAKSQQEKRSWVFLRGYFFENQIRTCNLQKKYTQVLLPTYENLQTIFTFYKKTLKNCLNFKTIFALRQKPNLSYAYLSKKSLQIMQLAKKFYKNF